MNSNRRYTGNRLMAVGMGLVGLAVLLILLRLVLFLLSVAMEIAGGLALVGVVLLIVGAIMRR